MSIEFQCSGCNQTLRVPENLAGKRAKCPKCGAIFQIPATAPPPPIYVPPDAGALAAANPYHSPQVSSLQPATTIATGPVGNQRVEVGQVLSYAWEIWKAKLGLLVGAFVTFYAITYGIGFFLEMLQAVLAQNRELALAISVVGNIVLNMTQIYLGIGHAQIGLKLARQQPATISDLFGGGPRFPAVLGACILAGLAVAIGVALCVMSGIALAQLELSGPAEFGLVLCIASCAVAGFTLVVMIWPFYYLVVDDKSQVFNSFSTAYKITKGNRGTTFVLWLLSAGIMLAGLMALCIGFIFAGPLVSMLWATAYLMMSGQISTNSPRAEA